MQAPDPPVRGGLVRGTGTLLPETVVDVNSLVLGRIQKIHPTGDWNAVVKKGDPLAEIDSTLFEADLPERAGSTWARPRRSGSLPRPDQPSAKRDLDRARQLLDTGLSSRPEIDKRTAAMGDRQGRSSRRRGEGCLLQSVLDRAKIDLDACVIRSPIDGAVIDRRVTVGQIANPSANVPSLFLIASDLRLEVATPVRAADIPRVSEASDGARSRSTAFPNETFKGEVVQVGLNASVASMIEIFYSVIVRTDNSARRSDSLHGSATGHDLLPARAK